MTKEGTLTLLPNGGAVLGCPADASSPARITAETEVQNWDRESLLVLPFPVTVVDLRYPAIAAPYTPPTFTDTCTCPTVITDPSCSVHYSWTSTGTSA